MIVGGPNQSIEITLPLANNYVALLKVQISLREAHQFTASKAAGVKQPEDGKIAQAHFRRGIDSV